MSVSYQAGHLERHDEEEDEAHPRPGLVHRGPGYYMIVHFIIVE